MPGCYVENYKARCEHRQRAVERTRAKYPALIEGSSGWFRALANQLRKP